MTNGSVTNVFEITYGTPKSQLSSSDRCEVHILPRREPKDIEDDGLGCVHAIRFVMVFNVMLAASAFAVWELLKHWR